MSVYARATSLGFDVTDAIRGEAENYSPEHPDYCALGTTTKLTIFLSSSYLSLRGAPVTFCIF